MNYALVVAAGKGTRVKGYNVPKQFIKINNIPLIIYTLKKFQNNKNIDGIFLVTSKDDLKEMISICANYEISKLIALTKGGNSRQQSVLNGLLKLKEYGVKDNDVVLIHDGARANISDEIIDNNIEASKVYKAIITATRSVNSLVKGNSFVNEYVNRKAYYEVQTPQTFNFALILKAHLKFKGERKNTDDGMLIKKMHRKVKIVNGSSLNFKITYNEDIELFKKLI